MFIFRKLVNIFYYTLKEPYDQTPFSNAILQTTLYDTNIDFSSYMGFVTSVFNRKDDTSDILQAILKLSTEVSEVADIVSDETFFNKRISRSSKIAEMGDIFFYFTLILAKWKFSLSDVMAANFIKLKSRYPNG
jgi:NTP pyrophosphatase (non-canonical NTP hydrolase)